MVRVSTLESSMVWTWKENKMTRKVWEYSSFLFGGRETDIHRETEIENEDFWASS